MDLDLATRLEHRLVDELVVDDEPELRIESAVVDSTGHAPVRVSVVYDYGGQRGSFVRPFDAVDVQMLTDPTVEQTALAFANWVLDELVEHISDLIAAGDWPPSS